MKYRLMLPGLLTLLFVFAACSPPPELRDNSLLQDSSLLSNDPCSAPCWRGITPGETVWRDALAILEDEPDLDAPQVQEDENSGAIVAEFQQAGGSPCCQMFSETGETVDILFLRLAPTTTLGQLIERWGDPSYVVGSPFSETQAIMNLIYPEIPLVVYAFVEGEATGRLNEGSELVGVLYLKQSDMDLLLQTSNLNVWAGLDTYQVYASSTYALTPSVTLTPTPSDGG